MINASPQEIRALIRLLATASQKGTGTFMLDYYQNFLCRIALSKLLPHDVLEINPFANEPPAAGGPPKTIAEVTEKYWPSKETAREAAIRRRDEFIAARDTRAGEVTYCTHPDYSDWDGRQPEPRPSNRPALPPSLARAITAEVLRVLREGGDRMKIYHTIHSMLEPSQ